jgi:hypothetical protein
MKRTSDRETLVSQQNITPEEAIFWRMIKKELL